MQKCKESDVHGSKAERQSSLRDRATEGLLMDLK